MTADEVIICGPAGPERLRRRELPGHYRGMTLRAYPRDLLAFLDRCMRGDSAGVDALEAKSQLGQGVAA